MKPIYEEVPVFENNDYLLRFVTTEDYFNHTGVLRLDLRRIHDWH